MAHKNFYIFVLFYFVFCTKCFAQTDNSILVKDFYKIESATESLMLDIENLNFFKNNEWDNDHTKGYTSTGMWIKPVLQYNLNPNVRLNAGMYALRYSGRDNIETIEPLFSLTYNFNKNFSVILGNLYGSLGHGIIEPLYKFENYYTNSNETGIQVKFKNTYFTSDTWVDWEKFITSGDNFQEEFTFGSSNTLLLSQIENYKIDIVNQILIKHKGGEINTNEANVQSIVNGLIGVRLYSDINRPISWGIMNSMVQYKDISHTKLSPFDTGWANYTSVFFNYKNIALNASYWHSNKFISIHGDYLFQSISEKKENYIHEKRNILSTKFSYNNKMFKNVSFNFRVESYFDLIKGKMDFATGINVFVNQQIFMKTKANKNTFFTEIKNNE